MLCIGDGNELFNSCLPYCNHCHDRVVFRTRTHELSGTDLDTGDPGIDLLRFCHQDTKLCITRRDQIWLKLTDVFH